MDQSMEYSRLCEFVREIRSFYTRDKRARVGELMITKAMISFALPEVSDKDLNELLDSLKAEGYIISMHDDQLTFSSRFPNASC